MRSLSIPTSRVTAGDLCRPPFIFKKQHPLFPNCFSWPLIQLALEKQSKTATRLYLLRGVTAERAGGLAAALSVPSAFPAYRYLPGQFHTHPAAAAAAPPHLQSGRCSDAGDEQRLRTSPLPLLLSPPPTGADPEEG